MGRPSPASPARRVSSTPRRASATRPPTVTSAIGGGLECAAPLTSVPPCSRSPLFLRFLTADELEDARRGRRTHEARAELLAAQESRDAGERLQVLARGALRSDH